MSEWISVKDRLPAKPDDDGSEVSVVIDATDGHTRAEMTFSTWTDRDGFVWSSWSSQLSGLVTHWRKASGK